MEDQVEVPQHTADHEAGNFPLIVRLLTRSLLPVEMQ
jgi:hypothetical protein